LINKDFLKENQKSSVLVVGKTGSVDCKTPLAGESLKEYVDFCFFDGIFAFMDK
jgi:hypothetical protein